MDIVYSTAGDDDGEALFGLVRHAFAADSSYDPDLPVVGNDHTLVAKVDGRPVGKVATIGFGQWINGASISMAGVTGVAVEPHVAGRGIAKRLLSDALHDAAARGELISSLYPTTASLYRSVGFEVAGGWGRRAIPVADLRTDVAEGITVEPADVSIITTETHVYDDHARFANGWVDRCDLWNERMVYEFRRDADKNHLKVYRAVRDGDTIAVAVLQTVKPTTYSHRLYDFRAEQLWGDAAGVRAIGAVIAGHGTTAGELQVHLPRHELDSLTAHPQHARLVEEWPWMTRIVDLPGALAARPTPLFGGEVHLRVHDPLLAANDGAWVLQHHDGECIAEQGGQGLIDVAITDLAALYTGFATPRHLASLGALPGADDAALDRLTTAFRATEPWMVDFF